MCGGGAFVVCACVCGGARRNNLEEEAEAKRRDQVKWTRENERVTEFRTGWDCLNRWCEVEA